MADESLNEVLGNLVGIGTKTELMDSDPYLAVIAVDEAVPDKFSDEPNAKRWHLAYRPVRYKLNGATGCFHEYLKPSTRTASGMGATLKGLKAVGLPANQIATGLLVGKAVWAIKRTITFKGSDGNPFDYQVTVPFRVATAEEQGEADALPALGEVGGSVGVSVPTTREFTADEQEILREVLVGSTETEAIRKASKLAPQLRAAVIGGQAAESLGLSVDSGVYAVA